MEDYTLYNNIEEILIENRRRNALLEQDRYDPMTGEGCCGDRVELDGCHVPRVVLERHPDYAALDAVARDRARIEEDFEFWCVRCATIRDKLSCLPVPFVLNRPQRRLLAVMEKQRVAGRPVRIILLKARQWGGSTLVQMYMAWMQLVRHRGWNSLICCHKQMSSKNIKRMYNLLLRHYPRELLDEEDGESAAPRFSRLEGQPNVQQITSRDCLVIMGSSRSEDAVRGYDISMAHLSEVAYWQESAMFSPDDVVRSVCGSIVLKPETVIVLESTANGVGDYFHDEWQRSQLARSDKEAVFVPWHEIGIYRLPLDDAASLWEGMDEYERTLWNDGCTLEQINWYHHKRMECRSHELMMSEYPSNANEAFIASGFSPFAPEHLDEVERNCTPPRFVGDIQADGASGAGAKKNIRLVAASNGLLKVWEMPERNRPVKTRYLVVVDVGGRSDNSDWSVIAVMRMGDVNRHAAIVAQWRGHIDHDELAWKAMQLAKYYNDGLLVVESNTLVNEAARAGESEYILRTVHQVYGNIYERGRFKLGFHTNAKTKRMSIAALIGAVREGSYIERDHDAVNEMRCYEEHNGRYAARSGKHDDILMTRAIGLLVMDEKKVKCKSPSPDKSLVGDVWMYTRLK